MQQKIAQTPEAAPSDSQNAENQAINARLVGIIKANAARLDAESPPPASGRRLGYFEAGRAFFGLLVLMVSAYIYSLLVKKEA
jgi:hypothetical protein